ncbi:MAG: hypothetical protein ACRDQ5_21730 [Sciscionella sp.]
MYRIVTYPEAHDQIAALPRDTLDAYGDVLVVLELTPWNGPPLHEGNPAGAVRRWTFGSGQAGQVIYLILDEQREVHVALVQWLG